MMISWSSECVYLSYCLSIFLLTFIYFYRNHLFHLKFFSQRHKVNWQGLFFPGLGYLFCGIIKFKNLVDEHVRLAMKEIARRGLLPWYSIIKHYWRKKHLLLCSMFFLHLVLNIATPCYMAYLIKTSIVFIVQLAHWQTLGNIFITYSKHIILITC